MRNIIFLLLCIPAIAYGQQTINASIMHDNIQRDYILYIPASYSPGTEAPLVLCFHGYTSSAATISFYSDFNTIADTAGFLIAYPQGTLDGTSKSHWNVGGWIVGSTVDDVGFTDALLDTLLGGYNIDTDRIYSTGMSNGGYMSFLLACQLGDRIAAIASITGSMTPETYNACNPVHPTPVMQMHGTSDGTVPYNGAIWSKSIDEVIQYWTNYNNCDPTPTTTALPNTNTLDGSSVEHLVYGGGDDNTTVEHFKVTGGDHDWPGSWGNMDISASAEIWKFFYKYQLSNPATNAAFCDSLIIDCCSFGTAPTLSFDLTNNSSYNFSYPGFVLFNSNVDTVAVDDGSNVFTIMPGQQTRYLNTMTTITLPFTGYLNLYDDYFSGPNPDLLCTFQVNIQDTSANSVQPIPEMNKQSYLEAVYDMYGRPVFPTFPHNSLLFFRYSDGKVGKKIILGQTN